MDPVAQNRLHWKCRRGLLELDLVLERFLKKNSLREDDAQFLDALLDLPDNDLWDIVIGRSDRFDPRHHEIVARLRAA
jgi:antitoxin CptB